MHKGSIQLINLKRNIDFYKLTKGRRNSVRQIGGCPEF
jgi:hypothetical protein